MFSAVKRNEKSQAQLVDQCLVLSCPHAVEPIVWRMEVEKIGTASFEVKENAKDGTSKLVLKPKKGTAELIANFSSKEQAIDALVTTSNALQTQSMNREGVNNLTVSSKKVPRADQDGKNKWVFPVLGIIIVIALYAYMLPLIPQPQTLGAGDIAEKGNISQDPKNTTGVPVSADAFLEGL